MNLFSVVLYLLYVVEEMDDIAMGFNGVFVFSYYYRIVSQLGGCSFIFALVLVK